MLNKWKTGYDKSYTNSSRQIRVSRRSSKPAEPGGPPPPEILCSAATADRRQHRRVPYLVTSWRCAVLCCAGRTAMHVAAVQFAPFRRPKTTAQQAPSSTVHTKLILDVGGGRSPLFFLALPLPRARARTSSLPRTPFPAAPSLGLFADPLSPRPPVSTV